MSQIPVGTMADIRDAVYDVLPEGARPDFRPGGRWYHVSLDRDEHRHAEEIASRLRDAGYHVSVIPGRVKVTKSGVSWPRGEE